MSQNVFACCSSKGSWIFLYENGEIYTICELHFNSTAHRCFVKKVINMESKEGFDSESFFEEHPIGQMPGM